MSDLYSRVCAHIGKYRLIEDGETVLAAVSGGADSMCMLNLLIKYAGDHDIRLGVVHVDHGFRTESAAEAEYVENFATGAGIPFYLKKIEPGTCDRSEEAARIRRYELIEEAAEEGGFNKIALAHNAQDRAETMLFNLFRGSGISGLCGIRPIRDRYIRPILCLKREEIEEYLCKSEIRFCTDSSNLKDDYTRNRIRHRIIPEATSINAGSIEHMYETADDLARIAEFIRTRAEEAFDAALISQDGHRIVLDRQMTAAAPAIIRREIIRNALTGITPHLKDITRDHIEAAEALLIRKDNARTDLPYGICIYAEYDRLTFITNGDDPEVSAISVDISGLKPENLLKIETGREGEEIVFCLKEIENGADTKVYIRGNKYTKCFDYDKINKLLEIRGKRANDRITIDAQGHLKALSRFMIDEKIPERIRDRIPLICDGDDVIWIVGYRDSYAYRIDDGTKRVLEVTTEVSNG